MVEQPDISARKAALRARMKGLRPALSPEDAGLLCANLLHHAPIAPGDVIAGVWPLPGEPDLRPLLHHLHAQGHRVVLPETPPRGQPLRFRIWTPGSEMVPERFGTFTTHGALLTPDLLLVPLLAFDRAGYRLGYGGGYYDRTLALLPAARAIGFAAASQEVEAVPVGPHDRPLQAIATERGYITVAG